MEALRGEYCVCTLDLPGYGDSDKPKVGRAGPPLRLGASIQPLLEAGQAGTVGRAQ